MSAVEDSTIKGFIIQGNRKCDANKIIMVFLEKIKVQVKRKNMH